MLIGDALAWPILQAISLGVPVMSEESSARNVARLFIWSLVLALVAIGAWTWARATGPDAPPKVALVTADQDAYWDLVVRGAQDAADELGVELEVVRADGTLKQQNSKIEQMLDGGFDGFAVSPVDAVKQGVMLRRVSQLSRLVTLDSDAEFADRICFVGADNYSAGRTCGELVKQAVPDGGNIVIVMGPIDKANGDRRRQGLIDELLDRSYGPGRPTEPLDETHSGGTYSVVATLVDEIDPAAAATNVADYLLENSDVDCVVGLYAYSTPAALEGIAVAGQADVSVVGFDDRAETLEAIADGRVFATIAQDQYNYGYNSIRLLHDAASDGQEQGIPLTRRMHFPPVVVTQENIEDFRSSRQASAG